MSLNLTIRSETESDVDAITKVTVAAFKTLEISDNTEQFSIEALRAAGALTVSLEAELDSDIVGHIAFPPGNGVGRRKQLAWTWSRLRDAGVSSARHWHSFGSRRIVTPE